MTICAQRDDVEDLVLGILEPEEATRARAHLAQCAACRIERERFASERALFVRRAAAAVPAPYVGVELPKKERRRDVFVRVVPAILAVAASVVAINGMGTLQTSRGAPVVVSAPDGLEGGMSVARAETAASERRSYSEAVASMSTSTMIASTSTSTSTSTSGMSRCDCWSGRDCGSMRGGAMCEDPLFTRRVTWSSATP
jgi:anti-sigma factor RsiW